jgi:hypothetical protein
MRNRKGSNWEMYLALAACFASFVAVTLSGCRASVRIESKPSATPTPQVSPSEYSHRAVRLYPSQLDGEYRGSFRSRVFGEVLTQRQSKSGERSYFVPVRAFCRQLVEVRERPPDFAPAWHFDRRTITIQGKPLGRVFLLHRTGYVRVEKGERVLGFPIDDSEAGYLIIG